MFVKVYQYHIHSDKVDQLLEIQDKTAQIYQKYLEVHTIYLQSKRDCTKWVEISKYKNEEEYLKSITLINEDEEIQQLFKTFQSLLVSEEKEISEEDYIEKKVIGGE